LPGALTLLGLKVGCSSSDCSGEGWWASIRNQYVKAAIGAPIMGATTGTHHQWVKLH